MDGKALSDFAFVGVHQKKWNINKLVLAEACNNAEPSQTQQVVEVIKMRITKGTETKSAKNAGSSQDGHTSQQQSKGDNLDTSQNHNLHKEV